MNNVIIFHGTDCDPEDDFYWYRWLANQLSGRGYRVSLPHYPEINHEPIEIFLPKVIANCTLDGSTVLVGHSSGAPLILSILERTDVKVRLCVMVAGFSEELPQGDSPILQPSYGWNRIKEHAQDFVFINSVNDPWGCDDRQGRILFNHLGGTQIIRSDGHFGSEGKHQPYRKFPLLRDIILESSKVDVKG